MAHTLADRITRSGVPHFGFKFSSAIFLLSKTLIHPMGRKSKSKRSTPPPNPHRLQQQQLHPLRPHHRTYQNASAAETDEQVKAIVAQCEEAQRQFAQVKPRSGLKLLKKALNKYANYGIVHRISASMILDLTDNDDDMTMDVHNKYMISGLDFANKAVELEPNCVEYMLFFATKLLKVAETVKDFQVLRRLCEYALMVEDPADLHYLIVTVHKFSAGGRLAAVRRELMELIEKMKDLEEKERVREVERSLADAKLEEKTEYAAINETEEYCETSMSDSTADQKAVLNEEIPVQVTRNEKAKEAENIVPKTSEGTPAEESADENVVITNKVTNTSEGTPAMESADENVVISNEVANADLVAPDDGTDFSEPALPALSWEELIQYINQRLKGLFHQDNLFGREGSCDPQPKLLQILAL